jgi:hypothetical protein
LELLEVWEDFYVRVADPHLGARKRISKTSRPRHFASRGTSFQANRCVGACLFNIRGMFLSLLLVTLLEKKGKARTEKNKTTAKIFLLMRRGVSNTDTQ